MQATAKFPLDRRVAYGNSQLRAIGASDCRCQRSWGKARPVSLKMSCSSSGWKTTPLRIWERQRGKAPLIRPSATFSPQSGEKGRRHGRGQYYEETCNGVGRMTRVRLLFRLAINWMNETAASVLLRSPEV